MLHRMRLKDYLDDGTTESVRWVAEKAGVSHETVYKAIAGAEVSWKTAKAISNATGGQVTTYELVEPGDASDAA